MIYVDHVTLLLAVLLNLLLYVLISRRQILKIKQLMMYVDCSKDKDKEKLLLQSIADKERIITSYAHEINNCEREKLCLKDEIIELERNVENLTTP